jgi:uncharacterized membrane protein YfcA
MTAVLPAPWVVPLHGVAQLTSNFTRTLALLRHVAWRIFFVYAVPLVAGVALATAVWSGDRLTHFRPAIGVFLLVFLLWRRYSPKLRNPALWVYAVLGVVVGFAGVWVGATGPMLAPFFLRDDFEKEQVIATKAVCQSLMHLLKVPAFLYLGFDFLRHLPLLGVLVGAVIVGTLFGRWVLSRLDRKVFTVLFEGLLTIIAVYLLAGVFIR